MKASSLLIVLFSLTLGISAEALAKKGGGSHATSHSTTESHTAHPTAETSVVSGATKNLVTKGRDSEADAASSNQTPSGVQGSIKTNLEQSKITTDKEAAYKAEMAAAEAHRKQRAEQAASATTEASKRHEAELAEQRRQTTLIERDQRQAAWIARCNIQPVMTDLAIATCREVMTRSAP